jgi:hypothetical protein
MDTEKLTRKATSGKVLERQGWWADRVDKQAELRWSNEHATAFL